MLGEPSAEWCTEGTSSIKRRHASSAVQCGRGPQYAGRLAHSCLPVMPRGGSEQAGTFRRVHTPSHKAEHGIKTLLCCTAQVVTTESRTALLCFFLQAPVTSVPMKCSSQMAGFYSTGAGSTVPQRECGRNSEGQQPPCLDVTCH